MAREVKEMVVPERAVKGVSGVVHFEEVEEVRVAEPEELVFWQVNGEVRTNRELPHVERTLVAFVVRGSIYGNWECTLFEHSGKLYLRQEWLPAPGYAWSETKIYRLPSA
jgi:hypothetical protein